MYSSIRLYSNKDGEIYRFLRMFYDSDKSNIFDNMYLHALEWENIYSNPVEISSMIGTFIDNIEDFDINMWISLDKDVFINITEDNADKIIRYLYERYPY